MWSASSASVAGMRSLALAGRTLVVTMAAWRRGRICAHSALAAPALLRLPLCCVRVRVSAQALIRACSDGSQSVITLLCHTNLPE